jgi:hypothetical protein
VHCCGVESILSLIRSEAEPSLRLLAALEEVAAALARLATSLDAVCFRSAWRGLATAANRLLYNDVATEARFSPHVRTSTMLSTCILTVTRSMHLGPLLSTEDLGTIQHLLYTTMGGVNAGRGSVRGGLRGGNGAAAAVHAAADSAFQGALRRGAPPDIAP